MCHDNGNIVASLRLLGLTLLCSALALLFSPATPVQAQSNDAGLVGYWPFDEGSGTSSAERSGNGNTATLSFGAGFTTIVAPIPLDNPTALTLTGNAEATAPGNGLDNLQQLTIAAWVRQPAHFLGEQRYITLGNAKARLRYKGEIEGFFPELKPHIFFDLKLNGSLVSLHGTRTGSENDYHHIAGTYDGTTLRLYLDGYLVDSKAVSGTVDTGNGILFSDPNEPLRGELDEVRIYNRALTTEEIGRLAFTCAAVSEISQAECQALVALYKSTNGAQWSDNNGWLRNNRPCSWSGVFCHAGSVIRLERIANQLSGPLPPELGNLTQLQALKLYSNQLSGVIPLELSNLTQLQLLWLNHDQLGGSIPAGLCNLPLISPYWGYNRFLASDPCLDRKDANWMKTQTVPPTQVQAEVLTNQQIQLTWRPISYTADGGYYTVLAGITAGGPYTAVAQTANKTATGITLAPFVPGAHYLSVRTFTPKHSIQQSDLTSDDSAAVLILTSATLTATQGNPLPIHLNPEDGDTNPLSYSVVSSPTHGVVSGMPLNLLYTSTPGFTGEDSFTFKANDDNIESNLATITLHVVAAPPVKETTRQALYLPLVQR